MSCLIGAGIGGFIASSASPPPPPPPPDDPSTIANLTVWLKADAGITQSGGTVSAWADQSGNGNNFAQGTAANQPSFQATGAGTLATLPFLRFDGVNDSMTSSKSASGVWTWIVVTANKRANGNQPNNIDTLINGQENSGSFNGPQMASFNYYIDATQRTLSCSANGGTIVNYKNNATTPLTLALNEWAYLASTITGAAAGGNTLSLGIEKGGGLFAQVDIAEIIMFSRVITAGERNTIQTYLTARYG